MKRTLSAVALAVAFAFLALLHAPTQAAAASYSVQIANYAYSPSSITVNVGDTVTWTNDDTAPHTVTTSSGPQSLSSPDLSKGQSWSFTFTAPGTYSYYCAVHPYMRAQVIVRAASVATTHAAVAPATSAAPEPQRTYVLYTSRAAAAPVGLPSTKPASSPPSASASASVSASASAAPTTNAQVDQQQVADSSNIRALSPVLLLGGLTAAIAVFCLLLVGSRAASARPDPDSDPGE
jgi:amicyanin